MPGPNMGSRRWVSIALYFTSAFGHLQGAVSRERGASLGDDVLNCFLTEPGEDDIVCRDVFLRSLRKA